MCASEARHRACRTTHCPTFAFGSPHVQYLAFKGRAFYGDVNGCYKEEKGEKKIERREQERGRGRRLIYTLFTSYRTNL